jgi:hypothetical protein
VCVCMYVCLCVYVCMHACVCVCVCARVRVYLCDDLRLVLSCCVVVWRLCLPTCMRVESECILTFFTHLSKDTCNNRVITDIRQQEAESREIFAYLLHTLVETHL